MTTTISDDSTARLPIVKAPAPPVYADYSRDKGDVAILWLDRFAKQRIERPGYYVVRVLERDSEGRVTRFASRIAARRDSVAAAQHALDFWAARFVTGGRVTSDEVLNEWAVAVEKGLVRNGN